jgi:hydrocephalus-inducing protein
MLFFFVLKDEIHLVGELFFPNIHLQSSSIDFGCILNNSESTRRIKIANVSPMNVYYKWKFIGDECKVIVHEQQQQPSIVDAAAAIGDDEANSSHKKEAESDVPSIEEVFNISPLFGSLHPGEVQELSITYYGHKETQALAKAVCEIENGPGYALTLKGEASVLDYELSERLIDLGFIVSKNCAFFI